MARRSKLREATEEAEEQEDGVSKKIRYYASMSFDYGAKELDRGQIIEGLDGARNDNVLIARGYLKRLRPDETRAQCGRCGAWFRSDADLRGHGQKRHPDAAHGLSVEEVALKAETESARREDAMATEQPPVKVGPPAEVRS